MRGVVAADGWLRKWEQGRSQWEGPVNKSDRARCTVALALG